MGYTYSPLVETWALYIVGSILIFLRCLCRWKMVGFRGFQPDDYLIFLSWLIYSIMTYAADVCDRHADLHAITIEQRQNLTAEEAEPYTRVTKWFCAGVSTYVVFVWSLKFNMLFFYRRVVNGLWVEKFILPVMGLVACTLVINLGILFGSCRPYYRMWIVYPDQGSLCEPQASVYMLAPLIMNILTDLCIMAIPAPVVLPARTTVARKIMLVVLFSAGFFVMVAAVLRVTYVLVQQDGSTAAIWSCREDFVAIVVGQAPILRPALKSSFWTGEMSGSSAKRTNQGSMPLSGKNGAFEMGSSGRNKSAFMSSVTKNKNNDYNVTIFSSRARNSDEGSTENIIDHKQGIVVDTWVDVQSETAHESSSQHYGQSDFPGPSAYHSSPFRSQV